LGIKFAYSFQRDIKDSCRRIDRELADRVSLSISFSREGMKGDRGETSSISARLARRDPAANSAGRTGDMGDSLSSYILFPSAEAPKKGWLSRPRIQDVGRDGGLGSSGLKSESGCIDLPNSPEDDIDGVYILAGAVANGGLEP
jgi:hypothetical protein